MSDHPLSQAAAQRFFQILTRVADLASTLAERRQAILDELCDWLQVDAAHWAWGRGRPETASIIPLGYVATGYTPEQFAKLQQFALQPRFFENLQVPLMSRLRGDGALCATRRDLYSDEQWRAPDNWIRQCYESIGTDSWMVGARYSANDTWSNLFALRNIGRSEFGSDERHILDVGLSGIPWLWATTEELFAARGHPGPYAKATDDCDDALGRPDPQKNATQLHISETTVNDHVQAIFENFKVNSAMELAALFLQNR